MAITWRNIGGVSGAGSELVSRGVQGLSQAANTFVGIAEQQRRNNIGLNQEAERKNTDLLLGKISELGSIDDYNAAVDSGQFSAGSVTEATGGKVDASAIRNALLNQDNIIRREDTEQYQYDQTQIARKDQPIATGLGEQILNATNLKQLEAVRENVLSSDLSDRNPLLAQINATRDNIIRTQKEDAARAMQTRAASMAIRKQQQQEQFERGLIEQMETTAGNVLRTKQARAEIASQYSDQVKVNEDGGFEFKPTTFYAQIANDERFAGTVEDLTRKARIDNPEATEDEIRSSAINQFNEMRQNQFKAEVESVSFVRSQEEQNKVLRRLALNTGASVSDLGKAQALMANNTNRYTQLGEQEQSLVKAEMLPYIQKNELLTRDLDLDHQKFLAEHPVHALVNPELEKISVGDALKPLDVLDDESFFGDGGDGEEVGAQARKQILEYVDKGFGSRKEKIPGWVVDEAIRRTGTFEESYFGSDKRINVKLVKNTINEVMSEHVENENNRNALNLKEKDYAREKARLAGELLKTQAKILDDVKRKSGKVNRQGSTIQ